MCNEASLTLFVQLERAETVSDKEKKKKKEGVIDAVSVFLCKKKKAPKEKAQIVWVRVRGSG